MEEDLRPRLSPVSAAERERKDLRGFGIGLGMILIFFAWRGRAHARALDLAFLGAASLSLAALAPRVFAPLFRVWMPVVGVLARVNLKILSAALFYLVVTPYGLLLRAFGFSPLELALDEKKDSYWTEKPPRDPAESASRIF